MAIRALDAHCHADLLVMHESSFPDRYKELECGGITWSYCEEISSWEAYPEYWEYQRKLCNRLTQNGIPFFYLVGIHPRSIPNDLELLPRLPQPLLEALQDHLADPRCLGLGELGLDTGEEAEEKILRRQLEWAVENLPFDKRIGIHTPRKDKERITVETLRLLEDYEPLRTRIVIDHVSPKTWPLIRSAGYMAGMTLQDGKTSLDELLGFIASDLLLAQRIMLNSDGNRCLSRPYLEFMQGSALDKAHRKALLLDNACRFFNLLPEEW